MYLLNTDITVNWVLNVTSDTILLSDLDIKIEQPSGLSDYIPNAITAENYVQPTENSKGSVSYTFTASILGLWIITLTNGTEAINTIYSSSKLFISKNDIYTKKFAPMDNLYELYAWDITKAVYTGKFISVLTQAPNAWGITFNTDGSSVYVVDSTNSRIYQYDLSVNFDIFTAIYTGNSISVQAQDPTPSGITFNTDGSKIFITGWSDFVYEYNLSVNFDISTVTYSGVSVSIPDSSPSSLVFSTDGAKMYVLGSTNDEVYQYNLSINFDLSTASYTNELFSVIAQEGTPTGVFFSTDGSQMYITGLSSAVHQYTLSVNFDITTAVYTGNFFSVADQDIWPTELFFTEDGRFMYILGLENDLIYQYELT